MATFFSGPILGLNCMAASHFGHDFHGAGTAFHAHAIGGHSFHGGRSVVAFDFGFGYPGYFWPYKFGWLGSYPYRRFGYYPLYEFTPMIEPSLVSTTPILPPTSATPVDQVNQPVTTSAIAHQRVAEPDSNSSSSSNMTSANRLFGR